MNEYESVVIELLKNAKTLKITKDDLKSVLVYKFKIKSLRYTHISKGYINTYLQELESAGFGHWDSGLQVFILDQENKTVKEFLIKKAEGKGADKEWQQFQ